MTDCHVWLTVHGVLTIFVFDQAEVGHNWRVKTHPGFLKALCGLLEIGQYVLLSDEGAVHQVAIAETVIILRHDLVSQLVDRAVSQMHKTHFQLLRLHDTKN